MQILFNHIRDGEKPNKELPNGLKVFDEDIYHIDAPVEITTSASGGLQIKAKQEDEFGNESHYVFILERTDIEYLKKNGLI